MPTRRRAGPRLARAHRWRPSVARVPLPCGPLVCVALTVPINSAEDVEGIRRACKLGREVLDLAHAAVRPGITTDEIDRIVHEAIIEAGAYPSPYNYFHFPKSVCTSVNEVWGERGG